jgi:hypothetical protein
MRRGLRCIVLWASGCMAVTLGLAGCDGGGNGPLLTSSGVDRGKYLDMLTTGELQQVCAFVSTAEGGPAEHACGDAGTVTTYTVEECVASAATKAVHCQVALIEDCATSLRGDACQLLTSSACKSYIACATARD